MSDLQCPARIRVVRPLAPVAEPADLLTPEEPAAVVHPVRPGEVVDLVEVADLYRGEAVLLVVDEAPRQLPDLAPGEDRWVEVDGSGVRPRSQR